MSEEWQIDEMGRRFRKIGNCKEYEPEVCSTFGVFPKSEFDHMDKSRPEAHTEQKREMRCPFSKGMEHLCGKSCARYVESGCGIVTGDPPRAGGRCPLPGMLICGEDCALWGICSKKELGYSEQV